MSDNNHDGALFRGAGFGTSGRGRWLAGAAGIGAVGTIAGATVARSMLNRRAAADDPFAY